MNLLLESTAGLRAERSTRRSCSRAGGGEGGDDIRIVGPDGHGAAAPGACRDGDGAPEGL